MPRYEFIIGVSLSMLEQELNRRVASDPCLALNQVMYAPGTGFVAVVERSEGTKIGETQPAKGTDEVKKSQGRSQKAS